MRKGSNKMTILRTAAGSPPSVSDFEVFKNLGVKVVGIDSDPLSVGLFFADVGEKVVRVSDRNYPDALKRLCERESIDWILPCIDEELVLLASNAKKFNEIGTKLCLSSIETLRICTDKCKTYEFFFENGIPVVPTKLFCGGTQSYFSQFPQIVKPRSGRGSVNVFVARSQSEVEFFGNYIGDAVVQPRMNGTEYTIDVLANWESEPFIISPRKRLMTDSGISSKGMTSWHEKMVYWSGEITKRLKIVGPANFQCFLTEDNEVLFTEVNARLAGTSILSHAAGVPLYEGVIALLSGDELPLHIGPAKECVMLRYWSEKYLTTKEAERFGWRNNA